MPGFDLQIYDGSSVFRYTASQLAGLPEYDEDFSGNIVELASVELQVLSVLFLGVPTLSDMPSGPYRCLLRYDFTGTEFESLGLQTILNGSIRRQDIGHFRSANIWNVTLTDDSIDAMFDKLENQALVSAGEVQLETAVVASDGGVDISTASWFSLQSLFEAVETAITDLYFDFQSSEPFFSLSITYDNSGSDVVITRQLPIYVSNQDSDAGNDLPQWNGAQLFEVISVMLGWTVRAAYGSFPSTDVFATVITDLNIEPVQPAFEIDDLDTDERFLESVTEPEREDFALSYENGTIDESLVTSSVRPSQAAVYASDRPEFDREGKPTNRGISRIDMRVIDSDTLSTGQVASFQPDPTDHPVYTESINWTRPVVKDKGGPYVCSIVDVSGTNRAVISRVPSSPGTGQTGSTAEYWAFELFKNYAYSISTKLQVTGTIEFDQIADVLTRPVVADQLRGLRLYGENWRLTSLSWNIQLLTASITIDRPESVPVVAITQPFLCPPRNVIAIRVGTTGTRVLITWDAPEIGCGQQLPVEYEVIVQVPLLGTQTFTVQNLFLDQTFTGGGFGNYQGTITSVAANGDKSSVVGFSAIVIDPDDSL